MSDHGDQQNQACNALEGEETTDDKVSSNTDTNNESAKTKAHSGSEATIESDVSNGEISLSDKDNSVPAATKHEKEVTDKADVEKRLAELLKKFESLRSEHHSVLGKSKTCYDIRKFVALYFVILLFRTCISSYLYAVSHEIWKRYYITKFEMEFISGVEKMGFILTLIFSSFYGNKFIKPLSILTGAVFCGVGSVICSVPYFILGRRQADSLDTVPTYIQAGLCLSGSVVRNQTFVDQCNQHPGVYSSEENKGAYSLLCTGHFLLGIGTAFLIPAGIVYTDEAEKTNQMPLFIGVILSSYGAGSVLGSLFGYWFVTYPEHLKGQVLLYKWHIGAWWIGFILFGCAITLVSVLLLFFPQWIREPRWLLYRKYRTLLKLERWKKREQEARRRRRQRKREKLQKERERRNIKGRKLSPNNTDTEESEVDQTEVKTTNKTKDKVENQDEIGLVNNHSTSKEGSGNTEKRNNDSNTDKNNKDSNKRSMNEANGVSQNGAVDSKKDGKQHYKRKSSSHIRKKTEPAQPSAIEETESENDVEENKKKSSDEKNRARYKLGRRIQDLPKNLWFLMTRPLFLLTTFGAALSLYLQAGYYLTLQQYIQRQFQYSERDAALIPCVVYGMGIIIGCMTSGIILYKVKFTLKNQLKLCLLTQALVIIGLLVLLALGCNIEQSPIEIEFDAIKAPCAPQCDCSISQIYPVCNKEGTIRYPSPCHAGCENAEVDESSSIVHYKSCPCANEELAPEWCETQCTMAIVFIIILLVVVALQSSGYVTIILVVLWSLPEKLRSLTLGFSWWIIHILAFVPGVAIYNALFNTSCTIKHDNCQEESVCWHYDSAKYRYLTQGVTTAFVSVGLVLLIMAYCVMIKTKPATIWKKELGRNKKDVQDINYKDNSSSNDMNGVANNGFSDITGDQMSSV